MKTAGARFTLVEVLVVLVLIGIAAAVAIPRFVAIADDARRGAAQTGLSEAKSYLSTAYAKAHILSAGGTVEADDILNAVNLADGGQLDFGDIMVTFTAGVGQVDMSVDYDGVTVTDAWVLP